MTIQGLSPGQYKPPHAFRVRRIFNRMLLAGGLAFSLAATAQDYPSKPIKIVVPLAAGGGIDRMARIVADKLREKWGQTVIVENRGGAGGNIGAMYVATASPDGYTLLVSAPGPLVSNKFLSSELPYDSDAFVPVSVISANPIVLITHPKVPANSVKQLIDYAKANPDRLNFASQGSGTAAYLAAQMFSSMAGIKLTHIPYKGSAPALTDLLGGQVDMLFAELGGALPYIRANKVRALALGSEKRNALLPSVPTVSEVLPGYESTVWVGMVAPPKTPPAIANKLSAAIAEIMKQPDVRRRLTELSVDPVGSNPAEMASFMKRESERLRKVIGAPGMRAD
jgi:tripartite-type tricarboxylate transporter receptor subunit TctC